MMTRYTETDLAVDFESSRRRQEPEAGWAERVGGRESDAAVVDAPCVGRGGRWAQECEVPVEEVGFGDGRGVEVG